MIEQMVTAIQTRLKNRKPQTLIILGSGLGALGEEITDPLIIPYEQIPGFPSSKVSGHQGRLICGQICGQEVLCMQGRFHLYEGHDPHIIADIFNCFQCLGIKKLIVTNAAGSLNPQFKPGSLMLINDHINFSGRNPLVGTDDETFGPRFPVMNNAYSATIRHKVLEIAAEQNITLHEGVYLMVLGPNFETPAEIKSFQILGADAVGMSTVPEVIAAIHSGMEVLGISVITNFGAGMNAVAPSHQETLREGQKAAADLVCLIKAYLKSETAHG